MNNSLQPQPEQKDRQLAQMLNKPQTDINYSDDPLVPFLEEFKQRADFRVSVQPKKELWLSVKSKMNSDPVEKIFQINPLLLKIAAVLLVSLFIGLFVWINQSGTPELLADSGNEKIEVDLKDGSTATLRPHSKLYAIEISEKQHLYKISGEGYFNVFTDPERTFIIKTENAAVRVLGTMFTISDWGGKTRLYLEKGTVAFSGPDYSQEVRLSPGQYSIRADGQTFLPRDAGVIDVTGWLRNELVLDQRPLQDLIDEISHHFDFNIYIPVSYRDERLGGTLSLDDPDLLLKDLGRSLGGRFEKTSADSYRFIPD